DQRSDAVALRRAHLPSAPARHAAHRAGAQRHRRARAQPEHARSRREPPPRGDGRLRHESLPRDAEGDEETVVKRVLVVEDNEMNMQLVEFLLEQGGYEIVKAASGEEAMAVARSGEPVDLILMDIHLPGVDGLSVVQDLKRDERTRKVPILALTAHAMRGDKDRFLQAGCDGYISKPIYVKTFLASIEPFVR